MGLLPASMARFQLGQELGLHAYPAIAIAQVACLAIVESRAVEVKRATMLRDLALEVLTRQREPNSLIRPGTGTLGVNECDRVCSVSTSVRALRIAAIVLCKASMYQPSASRATSNGSLRAPKQLGVLP
jgi:hypothetical protein